MPSFFNINSNNTNYFFKYHRLNLEPSFGATVESFGAIGEPYFEDLEGLTDEGCGYLTYALYHLYGSSKHVSVSLIYTTCS